MPLDRHPRTGVRLPGAPFFVSAKSPDSHPQPGPSRPKCPLPALARTAQSRAATSDAAVPVAKIVTKAAASSAVISVILSPPVFAKALDPVRQDYFNESLQRCNALLSGWESLWRIAVGLAVLVVILGAVSAVLQGIQAQSVRIATAICGLLVTIVTGLTNTVGWDHRELNRSISKGQTIIAKMNRLKALYGTSGIGDDDKVIALADFGKLEEEFIQLNERPEAIAQSNNFGYRIINTAHADQDAGAPSRCARFQKTQGICTS